MLTVVVNILKLSLYFGLIQNNFSFECQIQNSKGLVYKYHKGYKFFFLLPVLSERPSLPKKNVPRETMQKVFFSE